MLARKGCFLYHSGARIGLPTPHMSIFSLGKGEKEHEVFKCEYARGGGSKAGLEYVGWRLESDFSQMKWRKQF